MRNSKFNDYLNEISTNDELKILLKGLDPSSRKDKLKELYTTIEITGHFIRKVNELLKETVTPKTTGSNTFTPNAINLSTNNPQENNQFKITKEVITPSSNPKDNLTNKEISISEEIITESDDFEKTDTVVVSVDEIAKLEDTKAKLNKLLSENESLKHQNDILTQEVSNLKTKLNSINISDSNKTQKILQMLASYKTSPVKSENINTTLLSDLIATLTETKIINLSYLSRNLQDIERHCIEFAICEVIYLYSTQASSIYKYLFDN